MNVVTTYSKPKPFTWSYSRLKNFEVCPKRHYHCDIAKDWVEEESEQLQFGNKLHEALAARIGKGTELPKPFAEYEEWCAKVLTGPGKILVEQKYAITRAFGPTTYFAKDVWYRGIADVVKINGPVALAIDWKTGKILEDSVQLTLMAACLFAHFPELQHVRCEFVWLAHDATTRIDISRDDLPAFWTKNMPRIEALERAHTMTEYPAKPGNLCRKWCPVKSCPHHGT